MAWGQLTKCVAIRGNDWKTCFPFTPTSFLLGGGGHVLPRGSRIRKCGYGLIFISWTP